MLFAGVLHSKICIFTEGFSFIYNAIIIKATTNGFNFLSAPPPWKFKWLGFYELRAHNKTTAADGHFDLRFLHAKYKISWENKNDLPYSTSCFQSSEMPVTFVQINFLKCSKISWQCDFCCCCFFAFVLYRTKFLKSRNFLQDFLKFSCKLASLNFKHPLW